ncbi:MAG: hypothetical protein MUC58_11995 [Rhizobiaceae bacterium]|jgi:hypothetical protein|nr:hypothetical protein [Rhizobiaceae bacterium]
MTGRHIIMKGVAAALMLAVLPRAALAADCGGWGDASYATETEATLFVYNNAPGDVGVFWSDNEGSLQFQNDVTGGGSAEFGTNEGAVFYLETALDGEGRCFGPIRIVGRGECHVSITQDADQFYLQTEGICGE